MSRRRVLVVALAVPVAEQVDVGQTRFGRHRLDPVEVGSVEHWRQHRRSVFVADETLERNKFNLITIC